MNSGVDFISSLVTDPTKRTPRYKEIPPCLEQPPPDPRWKYIRAAGLVITAIGGFILAVRAAYDGRISFYGTILKMISFAVTGGTFAFDPLLSRDAKVSYGLPKLFGFILALITLIGIMVNDKSFYMSL